MINYPKLPKQWRYWCRKAGLRPRKFMYPRESWAWYFLTGRGNNWRINPDGQFECQGEYKKLSSYPDVLWIRTQSYWMSGPIPKTEQQFLSAVKTLLHRKQMEIPNEKS